MTDVHYLSMIVIGVGGFVFGLIPILFSIRSSRYPLFLSLILCLGAGVLLATSLVHMLTEVQTKLKSTAELYFCGGFLLLYVFDEITHYFLGNSKRNYHCIEGEKFRKRCSSEGKRYGSVSNCDAENPLLGPKTDTDMLGKYSNENQSIRSESFFNENCAEVPSGSGTYQQDAIKCHVDIGEPCSSNGVAKAGLFIALLIHSLLEGVSIGVQTETTQILLILGAVSFHKLVLAFCLGLELTSYGYKAFHLVAAIFLFSIGSPIGIFIGMTVTNPDGIFNIDAQLQAVAAGSLLYVAAFEVLPRERFKWQHRQEQKAAGIFQLIFVLFGFFCITFVHLFLAPEHSHKVTETPTSTSSSVVIP